MPSPEIEGKPVFLDTNVFVYAATHPGESPPEVRPTVEAARRIVQALGERRFPAATHLVVLLEIVYLFSRWARARGDPTLRSKGVELAQAALGLVDEVLIPSVVELSRALEAFHPEGEDFNDRLILETLQARGFTTVVTADQGFPREPGLTVLSPEALAQSLND